MNTWPDGTVKSWGNGFTHGMGDTPHGYVIGSEARELQKPRRKGQADYMEPGLNNITPGRVVGTKRRGAGHYSK